MLVDQDMDQIVVLKFDRKCREAERWAWIGKKRDCSKGQEVKGRTRT